MARLSGREGPEPASQPPLNRAATETAYHQPLRRWFELTAQGPAADREEAGQVDQEILRLIDEVGEPRATALRRQWAREWWEETGACPYCGERGPYHDPIRRHLDTSRRRRRIGREPELPKGPAVTRVHDRGGWPGAGPIDRSEHELAWWEKRTDALMRLLWTPERRIIKVDEMRRAIESIEPAKYEKCSYYERWLIALETLLIEKGVLTRAEIDRKAEELGARGGKVQAR